MHQEQRVISALEKLSYGHKSVWEKMGHIVTGIMRLGKTRMRGVKKFDGLTFKINKKDLSKIRVSDTFCILKKN
jgi:hypothetical protein